MADWVLQTFGNSYKGLSNLAPSSFVNSAFQRSLKRKGAYRLPNFNQNKKLRTGDYTPTFGRNTSNMPRFKKGFRRFRRRFRKRRGRRGRGLVRRAIRGALRAQLRRIETQSWTDYFASSNFSPGDGTSLRTYLYNPFAQNLLTATAGNLVMLGTKLFIRGFRVKGNAVNVVAADCYLQFIHFSSARRNGFTLSTWNIYNSATTDTASPAVTSPQQQIAMYKQTGTAPPAGIYSPASAAVGYDTNEIKIHKMKTFHLYNSGVAAADIMHRFDIFFPINKFMLIEDLNQKSIATGTNFFKWRQHYLAVRVFSGTNEVSSTTTVTIPSMAVTPYWKNDQ